MEPDILRFVLLILAVVTVTSIYMWDRVRRRAKDEQEVMTGFEGESPDILMDKGESAESIDMKSTLGNQAKKMTMPSFTAKTTEVAKRAFPGLSAKKTYPKQYSKTKLDYSDTDLNALADEPSDSYSEAMPVETVESAPEQAEATQAPTEPLQKIIALSVVAEKGKRLAGEGIQRAIDEEKLQYGDMKIFHRLHKDGKSVVFSMINMVEPGYFEQEIMDDFDTPGITFFLQLPGPQDSMAMFSDMLFTVERFASTLGADVVDGQHVKLTKRALQQMQDEIVQFDHDSRGQ